VPLSSGWKIKISDQSYDIVTVNRERIEYFEPRYLCLLFVGCFDYSSTLRWGRHVPSKRRLMFNGLHSVVSQKVDEELYFYRPAYYIIYTSAPSMHCVDFDSSVCRLCCLCRCSARCCLSIC
jgi:hypothetical protein